VIDLLISLQEAVSCGLFSIWSAEAAVGAHAHAKVDQMISYVELPCSPLVSACSIFASGIAFLDWGWVIVLVVLITSLPEAKYATAAWVMRDQILVVHYSILVWHLLGGECGVSLVPNTWLPEVVHRDTVAETNEVHCSKLCHSTSQTVSSCLDSRSCVNSL